MEKMKKFGKIAIVLGIVSLVLCVVCFVGLAITSSIIEEEWGYEVTAKEIEELIVEGEEWCEYLGGSLADVAEYVGVSSFGLICVRLFIALKTPTMVIGIILLLVGIAIQLLTKNPSAAKKISDTVVQGASTVGSAVKTTFDNATVKCEKCGKTFVAGTKFCSGCGNKLEKETESVKMKSCPVCGASILEDSKFCSSCGAVIEEEKDNGIVKCEECGKEYEAGTRFCSSCGKELK